MVELFPLTGTSSIFGPGADNGYGSKSDGGHDTSTGVYLDPNLPHGAAPMRNQLKRLVDHLEGKPIDPRYPVKGDYVAGFKDGNVATLIEVDNGGLDKNGRPTADQDLVHNAAVAMKMRPSGTDALENNKGATYVAFATASSFAKIKEEDKPALLAEAKELLAVAEDEGRLPIYRPSEGSRGVSKSVGDDFQRRLVSLEKKVYDAPSVATLNRASQIAKDFNEGKVGLDAFKEVSATDLRPDLMVASNTKATTQLPSDIEVATPTAGEASYVYDPKTSPMTKERAERSLTAGLERQAPDESNQEYARRKKEKMDENYSLLPADEQDKMRFFFAMILFALGEKDAATALIEGMSPGAIASGAEYDEPISSTGTGGRSYNRSTGEYDGPKQQVMSANAKGEATLANYSKTVDPSSYTNTGSTLKTGSIGEVRDAIKQEYTSRLKPYLYEGAIKDIPAGVPVVVLDLGHLGKGSDLGSGQMLNGGYQCEAGSCMEANLAMAKKFHEQGFVVVSTSQSARFENNTLSPSARKEFTQNVVSAVGQDRLFFISTHYNEAGSPSVKGSSVFFDKENAASIGYAKEIQGALTQSGQFVTFGRGVGGAGLFDEHESQHKDGLLVTTSSYPSVLAELGFRDGDRATLTDKSRMAAVGDSIAEAVTNVGTQRFAWKLKEKDSEIVKTSPEAPAPVAPANQPAETAQVGKGDGSMLRVKADDKPDFAALVQGVKVPNMVEVPKAKDETVSIEGAKKLTAGLELKTQTERTKDGYPPKVDSSVTATPDPATVSAPARSS